MKMKSKHLKISIILVVLLELVCIWFIRQKLTNPGHTKPSDFTESGSSSSRENNQVKERCRPPSPSIWNKDFLPYQRNVTPTVNCVSPNNTALLNSSAFAIKDGRYIHQVLNVGVPCCAREITEPEGSNAIRISKHCSPILKPMTKISKDVNFIAIECIDKEKQELVYTEVFPVVHKVKKKKPSHSKQEKLNVLIFLMESTSRQNFHRNLPLTDSFMQRSSEAEVIFLKGHNKVGECTVANFLPLLTGLRAQKFREKCMANMDSCSFLWNHFSSKGYVTSYNEDFPNNSPIHDYFPNTYEKQPADYHLRPVFFHADLFRDYYNFEDIQCIGPRFGFDVLLENVKTMIEVNPNNPFFHFVWMQLGYWEMSQLRKGDEILEDFMKYLETTGVLNTTAVFFVGDHGYRKALRKREFKYTRNGALEDRMPLGLIMLPRWFRTSYPNSFENLKTNSKMMSSQFDMHKTILHILSLKDDKNMQNYPGTGFGTSLFNSISRDRTCLSAGIPLMWCLPCFPRYRMGNSDEHILNDVADFLMFMLQQGINNTCLSETFPSKNYDEHSSIVGWKWDRRDVQRELCSRDGREVLLEGFYGQQALKLNVPCGSFFNSEYHIDIIYVEIKSEEVEEDEWPYVVGEVVRYYNQTEREWRYHLTDEVIFTIRDLE